MELYEVTGAVLQLTEMLLDGEIDEQAFSDTVEGLNGEKVAEDTAKSIKNCEALVKSLKDEIDRLTAKKQRAESAVNRLKKAVLDYLNATNQKKIKTELFSISRSSTKSAEITDEKAVPEKYLIPQNPKIDKKLILADLKNGEEIEGARLKVTEYAVIR